MDDNPGSRAESIKTSLANPDGNLSRPLERGAVLLLETQIALQSLETSQTVAILLAMLHGIVTNTTSGDVIELGVYHAKDICQQAGIPESSFEEVAKKFAAYSKAARSWNPLAY